MNKADLSLLPRDLSLPHDSAHLHVNGAATFVDDQPKRLHEKVVGLVYSPHARARIVSLNTSRADSLAGVIVMTAKDLHHNTWGPIFSDQPLIAEHEVNFVGEVVAVVAANSEDDLKRALGLVHVVYQVLPPILSISDAINSQSFIGNEREIKRGNAEINLPLAPHRRAGTLTLKGADHFYLENQSVIVYPEDDDHFEVHSSTQHPTETQAVVAEALGLAQHAVVSIVHRLGGGFGGKETQAAPFAVYAAMIAKKAKKPARLVLNKDDDMIITGKRNPYEITYDVGFDDEGRLLALDCFFYGDGGAYADLSTAILERAMAHVDNAYYLPHVTIRGIVCRTNFQPHTAFRGFGGPKGVALIEHIMEEIGHELKIDGLDVRLKNCYRGDNNTTPYGQKVDNNLLPDLFVTLAERCDYRKRRQALNEWNDDPANHPRGMAMTAIKFGICFTARFFNQGHALVHILRDGSVQVATGAVEMGQGVNVRIRSVVADCFGIAPQLVRVLKTATDKNANTSPTAASSGTDLNATAAKNACMDLRERLSGLLQQLVDMPVDQWPQKAAVLGSAPEIDLSNTKKADAIFANGEVFLKSHPKITVSFRDLVNAAYLNRCALSAYGFYKVPGVSFNKITGQGHPFLYFTQGVACSEVEIDPFTGQMKTLRTDILMDAGNPINLAMDRGQIAGGFIQGLGWMTTENLYYDQAGKLSSHSPSTYKIPSIHDIPRIFNIDCVKNDENIVNLYGTKAMGEPPLMLCFSVWNALKNAIAYRRTNHSPRRLEPLSVPATAEILLGALKNTHDKTLGEK